MTQRKADYYAKVGGSAWDNQKAFDAVMAARRERRVVAENAERELAIVEEATPAYCELRVTQMLHREGGPMDDHESVWLQCTDAKCTCEKFWVATGFVNGRVDIRPMTEREIEQHAHH